MATTITQILNEWANLGVFSYVIPGLLIFAVVFGILQKSKIFGDKNKGVNAIIAAAVGLLALQFDFVSTFFANIFPRFGVALAAFIVLIILAGLFFDKDKDRSTMYTIGIVLGAAVILWALSSWNFWGNGWGLGYWFENNFWAIIIGVVIIVAIALVVKEKSE